ncbi:MAG: chemotaxis protein, partial [Rhodoferax sp.]|nr:chemotaxis protein [Rhodoferax sp.]
MDRTPSNSGALQAAIFGDRIILLAIGLSAIASFILGFQFVDTGLAIGATVALLVLAGLAYAGAKGSSVSRYVLTFVLVGLVALHIQLARGMVEFHFGVFVALALLLVYRQW